MRGFVTGSLALIVLYTVIQPKAAERTGKGANLLASMLYRALSPEVAGIPNKAKE